VRNIGVTAGLQGERHTHSMRPHATLPGFLRKSTKAAGEPGAGESPMTNIYVVLIKYNDILGPVLPSTSCSCRFCQVITGAEGRVAAAGLSRGGRDPPAAALEAGYVMRNNIVCYGLMKD
jgi:hypothetical protein